MISCTQTPWRALFARTAFSVGADAYQWRDIVLASMVSGEWQMAKVATRRGLVAAAHARAAGVTLPDAAIDDAMRAFRYERNLASASATEAWLARWQLSVSDWRESLRRAHLLERFRDVLRGLTLTGEAFDREALRAALHADAVCASLYDRLARSLAARAAAHVRVCSDSAASDGGAPAVLHEGHLEKAMSRVDLEFLGLTADEARVRLTTFSAWQASLPRFHRLVLTDARLRQRIEARKVDWTRFACRLAFFPDRDMASEAVLCVRDDALNLADIAVAAHVPLVEKRFSLDEAEPTAKVPLLAARAGDIVGPIAIGAEWVVFEVREKRSPSEADSAARRRAESELLADGFEREIERSVRWGAS